MILIFVDQARRDAIVAKRLSRILDKSGCKNMIVNHYTLMPAFYHYRPHTVVLGNVDLYHSEWASIISRTSRVVSIPTEQLIDSPKGFVDRIIGGHTITDARKPRIDCVTQFMVYGGYQKEALVSSGVNESRVLISGSPRAISRNNVKSRENLTIGIALESEDFSNIEENVFFNYSQDYSDWGIGSHILLSSKIVLEASLFHAIRLLKSIPNVKFVVRPRLSFSKPASLFKEYPNIIIDSASSPQSLFDMIDLMIVGQSNLGTEAQIAGIPVISTINMNNALTHSLHTNLIRCKRFQYYHLPATDSDLIRMVDQVTANELPVSSDLEGFNEFVLKRYGLDRKSDGSFDTSKPIECIAKYVMKSPDILQSELRQKAQSHAFTELLGINRIKKIGMIVDYVNLKCNTRVVRVFNKLMFIAILLLYRVFYRLHLIDRYRFSPL